jgi:hypothetical protein
VFKKAVISAGVIGIGLALITFTFFLAQSSKYQLENTTPLRTILYGNNCSNPCWQRIAPGFTDAADVREMLDGVVDYQTLNRLTGEVFTIGWWSNDTRLRPEGIGSVVVVFRDDGIVLRITVRMDVCVSTILREYGQPPRVEPDGDYQYQLQYPDEGLFFTVGKADTVKTIEVVQTVRAEFAQSTEGKSWEDVENMFAGECDDGFSA